jgi:glucosyl-dolichyl phosphate glucuronosyltransferase
LTKVFVDDCWAGAGGRILPQSDFSPPHWLSAGGRYAFAPLALFDQGNESCELKEPPFGTNMAFRRSVFEKHGDFRTDFGPCPGTAIRNEDTEFGRRVMAAGERLHYVPTAVVYHPVSKERLEKNYHLEWWFAKGQADVREFGVAPGSAQVAGIPVTMLRRAAFLSLRWICAMEKSRRFALKVKVWMTAGAIKECFDVYRSGAKRGRALAPKDSST